MEFYFKPVYPATCYACPYPWAVCVKWLEERSGCSFCSYWWNCLPSLFILSLHIVITLDLRSKSHMIAWCQKKIISDGQRPSIIIFLPNEAQDTKFNTYIWMYIYVPSSYWITIGSMCYLFILINPFESVD